MNSVFVFADHLNLLQTYAPNSKSTTTATKWVEKKNEKRKEKKINIVFGTRPLWSRYKIKRLLLLNIAVWFVVMRLFPIFIYIVVFRCAVCRDFAYLCMLRRLCAIVRKCLKSIAENSCNWFLRKLEGNWPAKIVKKYSRMSRWKVRYRTHSIGRLI